MILSFTENGEMPIIVLVMRLMILFGEFSPNFIRDSHLVFSDVFSNEFFAL